MRTVSGQRLATFRKQVEESARDREEASGKSGGQCRRKSEERLILHMKVSLQVAVRERDQGE